jgi:acyl-CoA thioester hydrolase
MFSFSCEVYYEDTDMGGRVYYANYLKFIERARSSLLAEFDIDQRNLLEKKGQYFVVKKITADYFLPAFFGDQLVVKTRPIDIKRATIILKQEVLKKNKTIFDCEVKLGLLNPDGKVTRLPSHFINNMKSFF